MTAPTFARPAATAAACALVAAACTPVFFTGSRIDHVAMGGGDVRIVWNTAYDAAFPDPDHLLDTYEVRVDGTLVATHPRSTASCRLAGLASATTYTVTITAQTTSGEDSATLPPSLGTLTEAITTPAGSDPGGPISCATEVDTDGDRLPDWVETDTGTFVDMTDTGTDPAVADTDEDGIDDGDEVVGTSDGLALPLMGADPLRRTIFVEIDWVDDSADCGTHSHRPSAAAVDRVVQAFADAPVTNPDGTSGIDLVVDYGQGASLMTSGTVITDETAPIGSINGGVNGAEFAAIKAAHFHPAREGYFHYSLHIHRYNTSSTSSGQAEVSGDDLIVSLQCFDGLTNTSNTLMHELGHNLGLRHGGDETTNHKPNYNSVMNYRFQFPGTDADTGTGACDAVGDQILGYSSGTRVALDESAVDESAGVCGSVPIDFNTNSVIDPSPYSQNLNLDALIETLGDVDDWAILDFGAVTDSDGAPLRTVAPVVEQPVPLAYQD
ncbi:MAG: hypothetical protein R2707_09830 [Acidimicrobiales bacterium]